MAMKEVELFRILRSDSSPECHMYLREQDGGRVFPIIIHQNEMAELHRKVHGITMRRPMTHDLFAAFAAKSGFSLVSVEITELREEVFYARMNYENEAGSSFSLDARPSDAVAIATAQSAQLFAAELILDEIGVVEGESSK